MVINTEIKNTEALNNLNSIKNVECPYCGYQLSLRYDKSTRVDGLLVFCKGRKCKKSFILRIQDGEQKTDVISNRTIEAFKLIFGDEFKEHLLYHYKNDLDALNYINNNL